MCSFAALFYTHYSVFSSLDSYFSLYFLLSSRYFLHSPSSICSLLISIYLSFQLLEISAFYFIRFLLLLSFLPFKLLFSILPFLCISLSYSLSTFPFSSLKFLFSLCALSCSLYLSLQLLDIDALYCMHSLSIFLSQSFQLLEIDALLTAPPFSSLKLKVPTALPLTTLST